MHHNYTKMGSILLLAYGLLLASVSSLECHPPGPLVPRPRNLVNETLLIQATDNLSHTLDAALNGTLEAGWSVENTSFSIGLIIHDQPTSAVPGWEYHYLSANNVNGTKNITRDSQYLIGSISKVITVYILLKSKLDLDSAITQYLPVLKNDSSLIKWEEITLRQLASQVAGIPPNCMSSKRHPRIHQNTNKERWILGVLLCQTLS